MLRLENQLKHEKIENKTYQQWIKKIQGDLLDMDSELDRGQATKKFFARKEHTIQLLKKKLKIPATQLTQASELTVLEKQKDSLSQELNDRMEKMLKFVEEQGNWAKERDFLIAKIDVLNQNQIILEKERGEEEKKKQYEIGQPSVETSKKGIVQVMSQVSLKEEEIKGLKVENHKLV